MVNPDYINVHVRYGVDHDEPFPFSLAFCCGHVYASREVSERELLGLIRDIGDVLGHKHEAMKHGDLGMPEPEPPPLDDLPF